jgi:hypothetical protein
MMRSVVIAVVFMAVIVGAALAAVIDPAPVQAGPRFRIVDIRAEYGQLVVEAQHFNPDGTHWFFEHYTWQGREQYQQPRFTDQLGTDLKTRSFIKSDGREAPIRVNDQGEREYYLPAGEGWLRENRPHLDNDAILSVISQIHSHRTTTGWTRGKLRLTTHPVDSNQADRDGVELLKDRFARLTNTAYKQDNGILLAVVPNTPTMIPHGTAWGTVSTFYPDTAYTFDGDVNRNVTSETFTTISTSAGNGSSDTGTGYNLTLNSHSSTSGRYTSMRHVIQLYDTSTLDSAAIVQSATIDFVSVTSNRIDDFSPAGEINAVLSTPASDTSVEDADYLDLGTVKQTDDVAISTLTVDSSTYNVIALNSTGVGNVNVDALTKLGWVSTYFIDGAPTWAANKNFKLRIASSDEVLPGDKRPRLVVTHTTPSAAITGTIGDGATEQEVRDGDGTIIITLTGDTWVAAGGTFDAQRQAIIDGLDSAQSEATGWNAEVRDQLGVTSVVRTSSSVATITIAAADVGDYRIDDPDVVTVTVPNAALVTSTGDITATPTFTITGAAESATVSGTLGASGGTAAEIRAGGETIILTLANTKWVTTGATFDAQRQAIIDGLDSNQADPNGWDNRRADFAVGDVVRTSDTVVTITLSASTAYAIPQTETITAVVPAAALVYGAALTAAPTFDIVPTFQALGNRISGAIDLSSITDVAYCAIGWQANTPTNTSVTVTTSVDGGGTYSSATNGACPAGITVGGSLSAITDFRIKVALTTSDNTATPLVEVLGLLVQDTAGPALFYQLNTVPGITITDRSANSNTGTMSFPTSQAGINSITGVLESTRSSLSLEQLLSVGDIVSPVTGAAASGNIFNQTETGFGSLPFQSMMQTMATGGELPLKFVWVVAIGLFSIALGVVALHLTGSLMISGVGMGAGLSVGAAIGAGLIPGWTVILFVILALALIVMRSRGALPL